MVHLEAIQQLYSELTFVTGYSKVLILFYIYMQSFTSVIHQLVSQ